ncbi:MAG: hypothetical protein IT371_08340 [Deltaproteobacteria bacterium]|nr:hypothetical protein [Deltaproteobacteria bacterium]
MRTQRIIGLLLAAGALVAPTGGALARAGETAQATAALQADKVRVQLGYVQHWLDRGDVHVAMSVFGSGVVRSAAYVERVHREGRPPHDELVWRSSLATDPALNKEANALLHRILRLTARQERRLARRVTRPGWYRNAALKQRLAAARPTAAQLFDAETNAFHGDTSRATATALATGRPVEAPIALYSAERESRLLASIWEDAARLTAPEYGLVLPSAASLQARKEALELQAVRLGTRRAIFRIAGSTP